MTDAPYSAERENASLTDGPPVDLRNAQIFCANFCRVTGAPEDFILDFAMDSEPGPQRPRQLEAVQRVTLSPSTTKRLVAALDSLLTHYENRFGPIEIDVQRRLMESQIAQHLPRG